MSNIKLVVEIPEDKYLWAKHLVDGGKETNPIVLAFGNGMPLNDAIYKKQFCVLKEKIERLRELSKEIKKYEEVFEIIETL